MFWGLNLNPNRKYSQKTEKAFHISQAALDVESCEGASAQIFISVEKQRFLLCTLRRDVCEQVMLDLNFSEGNEICFQSVGSGNVTLSGYVVDYAEDDLLDDDDEEEDEDVENSSKTEKVDLRNKLLNAKKANKKAEKGKPIVPSDDEDEDEEDDDFLASESEGDEDTEGEEDDEEDNEEEEEDDSEEEEVKQPKAKQAKLDKPEKQQNGVTNQKDQKTDKKSKKELKKEKQLQQQKQHEDKQQPKAGGERSLSGGIKIVDIRVGNGAEAKPGKRTQVYYEGRLLSNNKVFDSLKSGSGFKFSLGRGEVIKGWDVGVIGMKVGGKRRITCPPHMAYGSRGSPPAIPPNSTLVFDVELKGIN